jgi:hypothetical protein
MLQSFLAPFEIEQLVTGHLQETMAAAAEACLFAEIRWVREKKRGGGCAQKKSGFKPMRNEP